MGQSKNQTSFYSPHHTVKARKISMSLKRFLLCLIFCFSIIIPVYGQDAAEEEVPAEDVEQAGEAPGEEAAPTGGGGSSDMLIGLGALYVVRIESTEQTNAVDIGGIGGDRFLPRIAVSWGFDGFSLGIEALQANFKVDSTNRVSTKKIAEGELTVEGYSISGLFRFGDDLAFYGGYGFHMLDVSNTDELTSEQETNAGYDSFEQTIDPSPGALLILGAEWELGEALSVTSDLRDIDVPIKLSTKTTSAGITSIDEREYNLRFRIITAGISYNF